MLQITSQVFDATPGTPGFLREIDFPVTPVLGLQIASPLSFIANVAQNRQAAGVDPVVAFAQQTNNRPAPDFLHLLLFKKQTAPYVILTSRPRLYRIKALPGNTLFFMVISDYSTDSESLQTPALSRGCPRAMCSLVPCLFPEFA